MKTPLKVTPLVKYDLPSYPSHSDRNPLLRSDKKEISRVNYYRMALLGAVSLFSFNSTSDILPPTENPIKFKELGFPHTYSKFGTGLPNRLDRETAVDIIDKIFKANDIKLEKNYAFSKGDVDLNVTGFNEKSRIGYVWLDHGNTDQDCFSRWRPIPKEKLLPNELKEYKRIHKKINNPDYQARVQAYEELEAFYKSLTSGYYQLVALAYHLGDKRARGIKKYLRNNRHKTQANYGAEILEKYDKELVDLQEMEKIIEADDYTIGTFSRFSPAIAFHGYKNDADQALKEKLELFVQEYIDWAKAEGRF